MDWVFENIQILIGIAAAIAYWLTHLKQAREDRAEPPIEDAEDVFGDEEDWEMPQREEARPRPAAPPPLVKSVPPPLPAYAEAAAGELERQQEMMARLKRLREERAVTTGGAAAAKARAAKRPKAPATPTPQGLRRRLRDRGEVRRAIVLREILGPPKALR